MGKVSNTDCRLSTTKGLTVEVEDAAYQIERLTKVQTMSLKLSSCRTLGSRADFKSAMTFDRLSSGVDVCEVAALKVGSYYYVFKGFDAFYKAREEVATAKAFNGGAEGTSVPEITCKVYEPKSVNSKLALTIALLYRLDSLLFTHRNSKYVGLYWLTSVADDLLNLSEDEYSDLYYDVYEYLRKLGCGTQTAMEACFQRMDICLPNVRSIMKLYIGSDGIFNYDVGLDKISHLLFSNVMKAKGGMIGLSCVDRTSVDSVGTVIKARVSLFNDTLNSEFNDSNDNPKNHIAIMCDVATLSKDACMDHNILGTDEYMPDDKTYKKLRLPKLDKTRNLNIMLRDSISVEEANKQVEFVSYAQNIKPLQVIEKLGAYDKYTTDKRLSARVLYIRNMIAARLLAYYINNGTQDIKVLGKYTGSIVPTSAMSFKMGSTAPDAFYTRMKAYQVSGEIVSFAPLLYSFVGTSKDLLMVEKYIADIVDAYIAGHVEIKRTVGITTSAVEMHNTYFATLEAVIDDACKKLNADKNICVVLDRKYKNLTFNTNTRGNVRPMNLKLRYIV